MPFVSTRTSISVEVGTMKNLVVAGLSLALLLVPSTQVAAAHTSSPCGRLPQGCLAYHWPIKPFNRQYPVRGAFGDPRTSNPERPFGWTGPNEDAPHSFHNGVDIVAADGTPVYPVVSGQVVRAGQDEIVVHTGDGRTFQYYHLTRAPTTQRGRFVRSSRTVLGWINTKYGHVHLAEIDGHVIHNPLDKGHLVPYRDRTRPAVKGLWVDDGPLPSLLDGRSVGPRDRLAVEAADEQAMPVAGPWFGLPQAPALVEWRLSHGRAQAPWTVAVDFRRTQPPPRDFWQVYGPGTYQNCPQFADKRFLGTPGRYLFHLSLHLNRRHPGHYRLAVRVADVRGNRSTVSWPLQLVR
jgi:hypothetical protein